MDPKHIGGLIVLILFISLFVPWEVIYSYWLGDEGSTSLHLWGIYIINPY